MSLTGQNGRKVRERMEMVDRRIQKTKKLLSESLIALILEKGYEHVTVKDILDKANVGRSTFYTHYENKEQLLLAGPQNLGIRVFEGSAAGTESGGAPDFLPLFKHAGMNLPLGKAMLGSKSGDMFTGHLESHLADGIREIFKGRFGKSKQDKLLLRYTSRAAAAAVRSFLISWLEDDLPVPAEEIAAKGRQIVTGMFTGFRNKA
jgi:hypothetical protein